MAYSIGGADMLTIKQKKVFDFIDTYTVRKGYPPSIRDICEGLSIASTSTVHSHLKRLEESGHIKRIERSPRTIKVVK